MDPLLLQPQPHSSVAVGLPAPLLLPPKDLCQFCVWLRPADSLAIIIITASGYSKKPAHDQHRIFLPVPIYDRILYRCLHLPPVNRRKSRNNSFSIFSRLFSYLYSASVFAGLRPRCFDMPCISFLRSRFSSACTGLAAKAAGFAIKRSTALSVGRAE